MKRLNTSRRRMRLKKGGKNQGPHFGNHEREISDWEVIALFIWKSGEGLPSVRYFIDDQHRICSKKTSKPLHTFKAKATGSSCTFVRLHWKGKLRGISVARLIWMITMEQSPPKYWEVHHLDLNPENNDPNNLVCLHPKDHRKFHASKSAPDLYVPFKDQF